jgi:hypothetical protein
MARTGDVMKSRELSRAEWGRFFDCFSRRFRGRAVTVELGEFPEAASAAPEGADRLAEGLPLIGITVEPPHGPAESIAVMAGDAHQNVVHFVRDPCRVRVAQLASGEDEMLIIDSGAGPTTRIDFRRPSAAAEYDPFADYFAGPAPKKGL